MNRAIANPHINEYALFQKELTHSSILECKINGRNVHVKKYKKLLICLYYTTEREDIMSNTTLNITQEKRNIKGFKYYDQLGISIQSADARRTLKEIINIIKLKGWTMELTIKLSKNDELVHFKQ
jgi:hypothetical protein